MEPRSTVPAVAQAAVLVASEAASVEGAAEVRGYDFASGPVDFRALLDSYASTGFQATNFARAVAEIQRMVCPVIALLLLDHPRVCAHKSDHRALAIPAALS